MKRKFCGAADGTTPAGNLAGAVHVMTDITRQKESALLLRVASQRLELALRSAKAGTWDWDMAADHIEWSSQMFDLFGLDPQTTVASFASWRTVLHPDDREAAENHIAQALQQQTIMDSDYRVVLSGGQIRWINAVGKGVYDAQGKPLQMLGICLDISERKEAEKTLRESAARIRASLQEKEVLLKEIHHRVKNNLQIISGLLTLQAAQLNDERLQRLIKESQDRIWTMALIHQTLYQSGNLADIDMVDYIRGLSANLLSTHAQPAMLPVVTFDLAPVRLVIEKAIPVALIINELLTNALKHAFPDGRAGEILISLQGRRGTARLVPERGRVPTFALTVADNGVGLPGGFDLKNQKSLGLQLVAMLAKQLGGSVTIESKSGTSVSIIFTNDEKNGKQS
jgi:PAS domain S-box-containing protein